jgi:hypothetical protein
MNAIASMQLVLKTKQFEMLSFMGWAANSSYRRRITVFVQHEIADGAISAKASADHLAIIEMDGYRIARIRDLTTNATI